MDVHFSVKGYVYRFIIILCDPFLRIIFLLVDCELPAVITFRLMLLSKIVILNFFNRLQNYRLIFYSCCDKMIAAVIRQVSSLYQAYSLYRLAPLRLLPCGFGGYALGAPVFDFQSSRLASCSAYLRLLRCRRFVAFR